jgi:hypothetical protein
MSTFDNEIRISFFTLCLTFSLSSLMRHASDEQEEEEEDEIEG